MRRHPVAGQIAHGIAGEGVYVDGTQIALGNGQNGMPDWLDTATIWCGQTGKPFAFVRGSQCGVWAGWTSQGGVVTSWGLTLPAAVLLDMAPDGTMLVGDNYQSGLGISAYQPGGTVPLWRVPGARPEMRFPYSQAAILDAQTASWTENQNGRMVLKGYGLPAGPSLSWNVLHHRKFRVNGDVWVVYLRGEDDRTIAHPWEYVGRGFSVPGFGYGPEAWQDGSTVTLCWSVGAGERAGDIRRKPFDLAALEEIPGPAVPLVTPIAPVGPVEFAGTFTVADDTPGNVAVWSKGPMPQGKAIIASVEVADQVPADQLLGLWTAADGPTATRGAITLEQSISINRPVAERLKVALFVYMDDRVYPFADVKRWCGSTPHVRLPQFYIDRRSTLIETVAQYAAEIKAVADHMRSEGVPWMPVVRCTTGGWKDEARTTPSIPVEKVCRALNATISAPDGAIGWLLFNWNRDDGVTGTPEFRPFAQAWLTVETTVDPDEARAWAAKFFTPIVEIPPMRNLTTAERSTVDVFAANVLLPQFPASQGDAPESWQDAHLRHAPDGWVYKLAQQMAFSHGTGWGQKRRGLGAAISNGTIALKDTGRNFHAYDLLQAAATGRPTLKGGSGDYYYVDDGQEWVSVPPFDHLGSVKPRPGRAPWPAAVKHGASGFDVAARVHGGDASYYDLTAPLPLNVFVYTTIDSPQTHRLGRTFAEGLVQTETLLKRLTADGRQAIFIMVCGPMDASGVKPTRAQILDMVRQEIALFLRYPRAVLALSLGNELFQQGFEAPELLDPALWSEVETLIPLQFPFAVGQVSDAVVFGPGSVAMMHPDRGKSSVEALQILADAQTRDGRTVVAREPARIEAGGSGQARGDINFVREELANAKRLGLPYFLHLAAGRGAYVPALDDVQRQALALVKAAAGTVQPPLPPTPTGHPVLDVDFRKNATEISDAGYILFVNNRLVLRAEIAAWCKRATGIAPAEGDFSQIELRILVERERWITPRAAMTNKWPNGAPA